MMKKKTHALCCLVVLAISWLSLTTDVRACSGGPVGWVFEDNAARSNIEVAPNGAFILDTHLVRESYPYPGVFLDSQTALETVTVVVTDAEGNIVPGTLVFPDVVAQPIWRANQALVPGQMYQGTASIDNAAFNAPTDRQAHTWRFELSVVDGPAPVPPVLSDVTLTALTEHTVSDFVCCTLTEGRCGDSCVGLQPCEACWPDRNSYRPRLEAAATVTVDSRDLPFLFVRHVGTLPDGTVTATTSFVSAATFMGMFFLDLETITDATFELPSGPLAVNFPEEHEFYCLGIEVWNTATGDISLLQNDTCLEASELQPIPHDDPATLSQRTLEEYLPLCDVLPEGYVRTGRITDQQPPTLDPTHSTDSPSQAQDDPAPAEPGAASAPILPAGDDDGSGCSQLATRHAPSHPWLSLLLGVCMLSLSLRRRHRIDR